MIVVDVCLSVLVFGSVELARKQNILKKSTLYLVQTNSWVVQTCTNAVQTIKPGFAVQAVFCGLTFRS